MAHEIENNNAFYVSKPAWHGLGEVLTGAPTIEEAWNLAYPHHLIELPVKASITSDDGEHSVLMDNYKAIIRDDGKQIAVVNKTFETVQPMEVLEEFRPLLESGLVTLETGMSLREGRQMAVLAKINNAESDIVKGDSVKGYFLIATGFDGSMKICMSQTNTRVVCANTLAIAIGGKGQNADHRFKHTKNVRVRMGNVVDQVKRAIEAFNKNVEAYKVLASKKVTRMAQETYIKHVFLTDSEKTGDTEVSTKKENIIGEVINLIDTQKGLELVPAIRGTAWQAYNAVSEYVTHDYGRNADTRLQAQYFGDSAKLNTLALQNALTM